MPDSTPFQTIMQINTGFWLSRCLHVVADLGVADALGDSAQPAEALAKEVEAHPAALARVLRFLSAHGVFTSHAEGKYGHNDASRLLRSDHPQSLRAFVQMIGSPVCWNTFGALEHSVRTGEPAIAKTAPGGIFKYFADHPKEGSQFNAAMAAKAHGQVVSVLDAYDFSNFKRIADIGGGYGHLLRAILAASPNSTGVLFDLPHVIRESSRQPADRLAFQSGDFFKDKLPESDAYLLMEVIHDWNDEDSVKILSAVRRSAPAHAKLLMIDDIIPDHAEPHRAKAMDINMLAIVGGQQRTAEETGKLLAKAGFKLQRVINTASIDIAEATPA